MVIWLFWVWASLVPWHQLDQALKDQDFDSFEKTIRSIAWKKLSPSEKRQALYWWGLADFARGHYQKACERFQKAIKYPNSPEDQVRLYFGLFKCHLQGHNKPKAQQYLKILKQKFPKTPWTQRAQLEWAWQQSSQ